MIILKDKIIDRALFLLKEENKISFYYAEYIAKNFDYFQSWFTKRDVSFVKFYIQKNYEVIYNEYIKNRYF